ncbi:T9SS type B sorting domain-containing protein [Psychroflexus tropicus]|uniref:T9SS type B sorting domain-containing protein n=1 Tax=Psychroflexus tropicus TaxID=197345 RepID=UPI000368CB39|nr:T9SS type B sorting domain-containing protein [Psychroflexus tropicus]
MKVLHFLCLILFYLISASVNAQLGFCEGNTGDPIFEENFGQGTPNGPPLPPGVTSYTYVNQAPEDGEYTISSNLFQLGSFHNTGDHTGNTDGKALIVNADFDAGLFYQIPITGLCIDNSYEFSAFLMNLYDTDSNVCQNNEIPVNVKFQITDATGQVILAEGDTGPIAGTNTPIWEQFGLTFTTLPGQDSVVLKMFNNGEGGCGNDLAIDDIVFRSCGDLTEIISDNGETDIQLCENETLENLSLNASTNFSVYDSPNFQWQQSLDKINWNNIPGETAEELLISEISSTVFYRVLVAEDASNVNTIACNSISSVFEVIFIDFIDPVSLGDVSVCGSNSNEFIAVQSNPYISVDWYDSPTGGNLLAEDTFQFQPTINGIYYAEATTTTGDCTNPNRVAIQFELYEVPELNDEDIRICEDESIVIGEDFMNFSYLWTTGESTAFIEVDEPGIYTVELTTPDNCVLEKSYTITNFLSPEISNIIAENNSISIETSTEGNFSYSIDGNTFQNQPVFNNLSGGLYTVYVRENNGCGLVSEEVLLLRIPEFFSPNSDQINDTFKIPGASFFDEIEVFIYDRYGKLLFQSNQAFEWNGTYQGRELPPDDYWYRLKIGNEVFTGNVTLMR